MLQPPGSRGPRAAVVSNRRKTAEAPDDVIRQLQRLAPNKRCADCTSKLPGCVNLTVGSFVCMTCAGIHRECNQKIKGVGHSSFTAEDVEQMKNTDNDKVNQTYLARYNPTTERLRAPQDNHDQNHLRAWIKAKYVQKAWVGGSEQGQGQQYGQPTVVQIPKQPEVDLFGGEYSSAPAPAPSSNQGWDAFGGSQQQQQQQQQQQPSFQANFADFGGQASAQHQPSPQVQDNDAFPADFRSSQALQQMQHPSSQQQPFQANFANFDQQPPQQPPQQPQVQQQDFGNFGQQQPGPGQPQQQVQHQPGNTANYNHQQPPMPAQMQQSQGNIAANFNQQQPSEGFANFSHALTPPRHLQHPIQQHSGGSENFDNKQVSPPRPFQQPGGSDQFAQHGPLQGQQQEPCQHHGRLGQPINPAQDGQLTAQYQHGAQHSNHQMQQNSFAALQSQQQPAMHWSMQSGMQSLQPGNFGNSLSSPQAMSPSHGVSQGNNGAFGQNYQGLQTVGPQQEKPAAMDHFAALAAVASDKTGQQPAAEPDAASAEDMARLSVSGDKSSQKNVAKFKAGQKAYYKSASYSGMVDIVKVHWDDELEPFYTISLGGKEKQTDDAHLAEKSPMHVEIESILFELTGHQLREVLDFATRLKTGSSHAKFQQLSQSHNPASQSALASAEASTMASPPTSLGQETQQQGGHYQYGGQIQMPTPQTMTSNAGQSFSMMPASVQPSMQQQLPQHANQQPNAHSQSSQPSQQDQQHRMIQDAAISAPGNAPYGGIPSPGVAPSSDNATTTFQGAANSLPGPPLAAQPQKQAAQFVGMNSSPMAQGGAGPEQAQQPSHASQGGNPFDIY